MPLNKNSSACTQWLTGTNFFVYLSHFLSAWGDRMWSFGVGLFLINISPASLQLTAAYGLSMGLSILLFGALVGDIVDGSPRLKAAQTALVLQNLFVVACAIVVYLFLVYRSEIVSFGNWTTQVTYAVIIILSVLSRLTSLARQIAVEKDWIVQICGKDFDMLATMTASLRRIDLATQVLAPIATGLIMTFAGVHFGALFIGGWNLGSVVIEYYFLWKVYNTVPALKKKKDLTKSQASATDQHDPEELKELNNLNNQEPDTSEPSENQSLAVQESPTVDGSVDPAENQPQKPVSLKSGDSHKIDQVTTKGCKCLRLLSSLERLYRGWPVYASYNVLYAGIALACLYMTVLGFDSVTMGYAKMQGVTEGLVGATMGIAASFGIFGTFMYPVMRQRLGLARTGIFGLSLQILSLTFCVVSVWMPGSPFNLLADFSSVTELVNCSSGSNNSEVGLTTYNPVVEMSTGNETLPGNVTQTCSSSEQTPDSYMSVALLLTGITTARFGLWIADLTINQLFMERVLEAERGKVNGVQNSLNQLMDMLKFLMVVLAPYPHQFGLLVLISFTFICLAWLFYARFLYKDRGHFFHFEKCFIGPKAVAQ